MYAICRGNFFPGLKQKAMGLEVGEGFTVIQTFEPHPLYAAMEALGFEHHTEQAGPAEFHVSFCRVEKKGRRGGYALQAPRPCSTIP